MPTVFRIGSYRYFFYAGDRSEPAHVHVAKDDAEAKFWLDPVRLQRSHGFAAKELHTIEKQVLEHRERLLESWNDYFDD